ncbi:hypothetical protein SASPL_118100 [Salvia splendens]|uniref:Uncharacterized protein n=1 Tax=Salvia splendens TaxID=180675 RepID=A0A8X8ZZK3_SALSN|nr:hypothetical protein SASPL_118100 [Salvia splendens]
MIVRLTIKSIASLRGVPISRDAFIVSILLSPGVLPIHGWVPVVATANLPGLSVSVARWSTSTSLIAAFPEAVAATTSLISPTSATQRFVPVVEVPVSTIRAPIILPIWIGFFKFRIVSLVVLSGHSYHTATATTIVVAAMLLLLIATANQNTAAAMLLLPMTHQNTVAAILLLPTITIMLLHLKCFEMYSLLKRTN